jgi:glucosylglycerate synthase
MDIAVCLPSYNESKNIQKITKIIDAGICKYYKNLNCVIVNADSSSLDGTSKLFIETDTLTRKVSITTKLGKGNAILGFFQWVKVNNVKVAVCFDSDLISIKPSWVKKMLDPIINGNYNFCSPVYKRSVFEGNTTSHLCYPIFKSIFKNSIRQPIAGDFAFDRSFILYVLKQNRIEIVKQYGIDIFLTYFAFEGSCNITEVCLERKIHNPSFSKINKIFLGEATALFYYVSNNLTKGGYNFKSKTRKQNLTFDIKYHIDQTIINDKKSEIIQIIQCNQSFLKSKTTKINKIEMFLLDLQSNYHLNEVNSDIWSDVLHKLLHFIIRNKINENEAEIIAQFLLPVYLLKTLTYLQILIDTPSLNISDVEGLIESQAVKLRNKFKFLKS